MSRQGIGGRSSEPKQTNRKQFTCTFSGGQQRVIQGYRVRMLLETLPVGRDGSEGKPGEAYPGGRLGKGRGRKGGEDGMDKWGLRG